MTASKLASVDWRFHDEALRIAVRLWGDAPGRPAVACVHGLSRNARDFDELAQALAPSFRVAAIDMPGRGDSSWLRDPSGYTQDQYLAIALHVLDALALGPVHWVGTSMGGLLGLRLASAHPQRVRSLVLNDVGAELDGAELARLRTAALEETSFADPEEAQAYLRRRHAAFGIASEERWRSFTEASIERHGDRWRPRFDPRAVPRSQAPARVDLWPQYLSLHCPVLVLRGAHSLLLDRATCDRMAHTGPQAQWIDIAGAGHAPDLAGPERVEPVVQFIAAAQEASAHAREST